MTVLRRIECLLVASASAPSAIRTQYDRLLVFHVALQLLLCTCSGKVVKSRFLMLTIGKSYRRNSRDSAAKPNTSATIPSTAEEMGLICLFSRPLLAERRFMLASRTERFLEPTARFEDAPAALLGETNGMPSASQSEGDLRHLVAV